MGPRAFTGCPAASLDAEKDYNPRVSNRYDELYFLGNRDREGRPAMPDRYGPRWLSEAVVLAAVPVLAYLLTYPGN